MWPYLYNVNSLIGWKQCANKDRETRNVSNVRQQTNPVTWRITDNWLCNLVSSVRWCQAIVTPESFLIVTRDISLSPPSNNGCRSLQQITCRTIVQQTACNFWSSIVCIWTCNTNEEFNLLLSNYQIYALVLSWIIIVLFCVDVCIAFWFIYFLTCCIL